MKQFSDCTDFLIMAPFGLWYLWAAGKFCKKFLGASKRNERLFVIFSFCSWLLRECLSRMYSALYVFFLLSGPLFFIVLVMLFFGPGREKKILAASILMLTVRTVSDFCGSFLFCLALVFKHVVKKIPEPFLEDWETGLISGVCYCVSVWAIYRMSKHLEPVFCGRRGKWYVVLAVPLLVIITMYNVAALGASNGIAVRSGGSMGLYYDQIFSYAGFLVLALLCMAAAGFYVFGMNRIYLEQEKNGRYHSQIEVYKMLTEQYRQSERLRHDMKNHIIALSALSRNKEWQKLDGYLKNMEGTVMDAGGDATGNKAVDALIYQKRKRAEAQMIQWDCDVRIPKECCFHDFDLCVLFGNILDNALEACARMQGDEGRFIRIQAKIVKKCFLIEVRNSIDRTEKFSEGFTGRQGHGIGLLNVRDVVNRYNGAVDIKAENGIFVISVLMPVTGE